MRLGASIAVQVDQVTFGLESQNDGVVDLLDSWNPPTEQIFFRLPELICGERLRDDIRSQFARYVVTNSPAGMRAWARELAGGGR